MTTAARRVRLTPTSAVRVAAVAVAALAVLTALDRSRLVVHWLVTAAAAALLLDGPVWFLARWVRRGIAVATVTVVTLAGAVLLTYGVVDAVVEQYDNLSVTAPAAAAALEDSESVGGLARRMRLVERTSDLVSQAPERTFGTPADAAQTAAERLGEAVLVITLTVFMLVAYERFEDRLLRLDEASRQAAGRLAGLDAGVRTGARSARRAVGRVVLLGVVTGVVAQVAGVPAPIALGLWMAWWRLLPLVGLVVGYAPLVLFLATDRPAVVAAGALLVLAAAELEVRRAIGTSATPGALGVPMGCVTVVAFSGGFELGGVPGAVVAVVLAHVIVGVLQTAVRPGGISHERPAAVSDERPAAVSDERPAAVRDERAAATAAMSRRPHNREV